MDLVNEPFAANVPHLIRIDRNWKLRRVLVFSQAKKWWRVNDRSPFSYYGKEDDDDLMSRDRGRQQNGI
jgi:hypothetical protein